MMTLSKAKIKLISALQHKKYRQKYNKFIVEGEKITGELLREAPDIFEMVFAVPDWLEANAPVLAERKIAASAVTPAELKRISCLSVPNKVLSLLRITEPDIEQEQFQTDFSLYLEGIRDPGNLGTILRIADWFGIRHVFFSQDCADLYNPKVVQASMGSFLRVRCLQRSLGDLRKALDVSFPVIGAVLDGENVFKKQLPAKGLVIIGNEGKGISPETEALLSHRISVPRAEGGDAESLNAAVAAGIICAVLRNR